MAYTPSKEILEKYADVVVNFALRDGKGIKKGDVVRISASESGKALYVAVCKAVVLAGGHVLSHFEPDESRKSESFGRFFCQHAKPHQLDYFPSKYLRGLADEIDHSVFILSDDDPHALSDIDPKKIMRRGIALKPFRDWRDQKEWQGKFTWTIVLSGTAAMAKEAGLSEKEYWNQIIKACFLDEADPIKKWKQVYKEIDAIRAKLNALTPHIDHLHAVGPDMDLRVRLGEKRKWLAGGGRNIPSFEIFTSPDWRGTEGWIKFNQPLYRYGSRITGIELTFKDGKVVKSKAKTNEKLLKEMIKTKGADRIGEYSLTDTRHSRITKFMAETLFDENIGGPFGNTHIALGNSYRDTFAGDVSALSDADAEDLGFNDSSVHTDIVSTTRRTVTAHMKDGTQRVIYHDGKFTL